MELVEVKQSIKETETTREDIRIYTSENLADNTFKGIINKYNDYRFDEHIFLINEPGFQSYSTIIFTIVFEINGKSLDYFLFISVMEIQNWDEVEYKTPITNEQNEETKEPINGLLRNKFYDKVFIKAEINIKYYKNLSLDIIDNINDYEEEEDDYESENDEIVYLPSLELAFFQDKCVVCLEYKPSILILPCLHICHCILCDEEGLMNKCPMCREKIERKIVITK